MCFPVFGMMHLKEPLLLIGKSSLCGGSRFCLSLSEWSLTICLIPYNRKWNVLSALLNKTFPSFLPSFNCSSFCALFCRIYGLCNETELSSHSVPVCKILRLLCCEVTVYKWPLSVINWAKWNSLVNAIHGTKIRSGFNSVKQHDCLP